MAELTPAERLQPCLLDRLTDENPHDQREGQYERVVSLQQYRKAVLRDLEMLLNARMLPPDDPVYDYPEAAASVINYGIPDLCAKSKAALASDGFDKILRNTILTFEPRVLPSSLRVHFVVEEDQQNVRTVGFELEGDLWAQPYPDHMFVKTQVDLETGHCTLEGESIG
jgi:type VI secretion system protein ImpF